MRFIWTILGFFALGIGIIGIFLPLIPTVPLVLLAAFCFAKSSDRLHDWLIKNRLFGPMISDWNEKGAIQPKAKKMATLSIAIIFCISIFLSLPGHVLVIQGITLACVMLFIWSRPNS
jgi:uncharacterized membrane protein YbaN (DUF454 family)